jgi:AmmeMemoRadiSam system protein A
MRDKARQRLLSAARDSLQQGLLTGRPLVPSSQQHEAALLEQGASFVTLEIKGRLRGCIGSLEPARPLLVDVAENAFRAGFRDPRFPPLEPDEFRQLELHIAVLNPPEPLSVACEAELLEQLRPGVDGLTLRQGEHRATFLPSVWSHLPEPRDFVQQLKRKGGWAPDDWAPDMIAERYTVETITG